MLRVTSNTLATRLTTDLTRLSSTQSRLTQQMATGRRLLEASDDVPATGRVMSYDSEKRALQQYERNAQRALTNIAVSSTALGSIKSITNQVFNLAPAAASSGDPDAQSALATQIDGLLEQVFSLANSQVSGTYLFGSQETAAAPFSATRDPATNRITNVTYLGSPDPAAEVAVSENASVATLNSGAQNQELATLLNNLSDLRDAVLANDKAAMATYQNAIGDDESNVVNMISTLSTSQFRIKTTQEQNTIRFNQLAELSGNETEIDLAETIIKYQSAERSYEAALKAGSNLLQQSLLDYI